MQWSAVQTATRSFNNETGQSKGTTTTGTGAKKVSWQRSTLLQKTQKQQIDAHGKEETKCAGNEPLTIEIRTKLTPKFETYSHNLPKTTNYTIFIDQNIEVIDQQCIIYLTILCINESNCWKFFIINSIYMYYIILVLA